MRERIIENLLALRVKHLGGEVRKVQWIGRRGAPDRLVLLPGRHFFVELKALGEQPAPHQERELARLRFYGVPVCVIDSLEQVQAIHV
jgi:hypothetical protein